jgi:hypothetical protein
MLSEQQKKQVYKLYAQNLSASLVAGKLNLSLNQIYRTLKKANIARRPPAENQRIRFERTPLSYRWPKRLNASERRLMEAALMLYRGEGSKTGTCVDFANSDPLTCRVFIGFLRRVCKVDKNRLRLYLYCFPDQDQQRLIQFWSSTLKVPTSQFTKPYVKQQTHKSTRIMANGLIHVRYSDKRLLNEIIRSSNSVVESLI